MNTVPVMLCFQDHPTLAMAGLTVPQYGKIQAWPGAVPAQGDTVTFADMKYPGGEPAQFLVSSRSHRFGGEEVQQVQLNMTLLVLHQP